MEQDNLDATFDLPTSLAKGHTKDSYSIASPISSQGSPSMTGSDTHLVRNIFIFLSVCRIIHCTKVIPMFMMYQMLATFVRINNYSLIRPGFIIQNYCRYVNQFCGVNYSRTSVARTLMARLPRLFRTRS